VRKGSGEVTQNYRMLVKRRKITAQADHHLVGNYNIGY
jgi:hypothetical protein